MKYKVPIRIEKQDERTGQWNVYIPTLRANPNKHATDGQFLDAGAIQNKVQLVFEVRYHPLLKAIQYEKQGYRIVYDGRFFEIADYDDYQQNHKTVKLLGVMQ